MRVQKLARIVGPAAVLLGVTVLIYLPALQCDFIWDDQRYVSDNPVLQTSDGLRRIWFEHRATIQYYPLVFTTFWCEYQLWELRPFGYHLTNVLLHAAGAMLLWRVLRELNVPAAWPAALVFTIHPVHVESVAWITERKNVLSGVFYFAALWAYLRWRPLAPDENPKNGPIRFYFLSLGFFLCALFSKTVTASLPAALLVITWWKCGRIRWRDVMPLLPMFAVGIALGLYTAHVETTYVGTSGPEWDLTLLERFLIAGRAVWFYAGKLLWPHPLIFTYPRWQIDAGMWWQYLFPASAIGLVVVLFMLRKKIGRGPLAAVLLFGGTLFPALGFFDVYPMRYSFVADHFQYLASVSLLALFVAGATRVMYDGERPTWRIMLVVPVLLVLGALTWRQQAAYRDMQALWDDIVAKNPAAWMAYNNRGRGYEQAGKYDRAIADYTHAIEAKANVIEAYNNLAWLYASCPDGQYRDAQRALTNATKACELSQWKDFRMLDTLAAAHAEAGKFELAIKWQTQTIRLSPQRFYPEFQSRLQQYKSGQPYRQPPPAGRDSRH